MIKLAFLLAAPFLWISCALNPAFEEAEDLGSKADLIQWTPEQKRDIAYESFLRGLKLKQENKPEFALLFYQRAWQHDSANGFLAGELAELYTQLDRFSEGLPYARIAWANDSSGRQGHSLSLGRIHFGLQNADSAKYWYHKLVENEEEPRQLFEFSLVFESLRDYQGLVKVYRKLLPATSWADNLLERQILLCRLTGDTAVLIETLQGAYDFHDTQDYGLRLVDVLEDSKREAEAIEVLINLRKSSPFDEKIALRLARFYVRNKELDNALNLIRSVWTVDTSHNENLNRLAVIEFEMGFIDSADVHFSALAKRLPEDHHAHFYLSSIASLKGDSARAFNSILTAITLRPDILAYQNQLAVLYFLKNNYKEAHAILDTMLKKFPEKFQVHGFKADAWLHQAKWLKQKSLNDSNIKLKMIDEYRQNAIFHLNKSLEKDSTVTNLFELAASYEIINKVDSATLVFEKLLRLYPNFAPALNYYGYTLIDRELDIEKGGQLVDRALVLEPSDEAYLDSKAWYLYKTGDYPGALMILEHIEASGFRDPIVFEHHALVLEKLNRKAEALEYWKKVLQEDPKNPRALKKIK
jgi:tetratricopeptide (TPR) repeat protein